MKKLHLKLLIAAILISVTAISFGISPSQAFADDSQTESNTSEDWPYESPEYGDCNQFLGMVSWDCHVQKITDEDTLKANFWLIVSNITTDIAIAAAYLVIGYVIYGGYLYIFSRGEPGKVAEGKKTLTQAFIGLGITLAANLILGSIRIAIVGSSGNIGNCMSGVDACVTPDQLIFNLINWFIGIAGVISVIFLIYGGVLYITSAGSPDKIRQAKSMIMYSLIGLAIIALSATITAFVSGAIRESAEDAHYNLTIISKEVNEVNHT